MHSPSHSEVSYEVDAAPIVPVARGGRDIIPNGLALNRTVHWAFDLGLIFVDREFKVNVTKPAKLEGRNEWILKFEAQELRLPENPELRPSVDALEWHRANVAVAK